MKKLITVGLLSLLPLAFCRGVFAQQSAKSQSAQQKATSAATTETQKKNIEEYVELLRSNVRQQKAEIMGSMMALNIDDSAKFWPIYSEYDAELTKLNDQRLANIEDYARNYDNMTDAKANELVQSAFDYRKQRADLLVKYYGRVKDSLGTLQAARFLQIENQLLEIIDLQIESNLPIVGQGS